jgi:anti-anti-sigma factor
MLQSEEKDGKLYCIFTGSQNTPACQEIEAGLYAKIDALKLPVVFDLKGVEFVGSMFLRICLTVLQKVSAEKFAVVNIQPSVKKVFKIAGFDKQVKLD